MKKLGMFKYLILSLITFSMVSCSLIDNDAPIPAYIVVNDVSVFTKENEGEPTHNITEVWAYADNQLLGVYPLPAKIPVILNEKDIDFTIFPGFRNNGEQSRSFTYNLMNTFEFTDNLEPGEEKEISPKFTYKEQAKFDFVEGFESTSHIFTLDLDENEATQIVSSSEDKKVGSKSGKISLNTANSFISAATIFNFDGSNNAGSDSYLEMDYKNDVPFFVGVIYVQDNQEISQPLLVVNPKEDWNKIYVDFTSILTSPAITSYRLYFTTDLEPLEVDSGEIFIDNLKFVHF